MLGQLAVKRLYRDYKELLKEKPPGISAAPLDDANWLKWHCNVIGASGTALEGQCIHFELNFDENYPSSAPKLYLLQLLNHPNVFGTNMPGRYKICLNLLEHQYIGSEDKLGGWSSGYSLMTILLQVQCFLSETGRSWKSCPLEASYYCEECGHSNASNSEFRPPVSIPDAVADKVSNRISLKQLLRNVGSVLKKVHFSLNEESGVLGMNIRLSLFHRATFQLRFNLSIISGDDLKDDGNEVICAHLDRCLHHPCLLDLVPEQCSFTPADAATCLSRLRENIINKMEKCSSKDVKRIQELTQSTSSQLASPANPHHNLQKEKRATELKSVGDLLSLLSLDPDTDAPAFQAQERCNAVLTQDSHVIQISGPFGRIGDDAIMNILSFCTSANAKAFGQTCTTGWLLFENSMSRERQLHDLVCFHFRTSFREDALGYAITKDFSVSLAPISHTAFHVANVRKGLWKDDLDFWLPIYISSSNRKFDWRLFDEAVVQRPTGDPRSLPFVGFQLIQDLMSTLLVKVLDGKMHESVSALRAFLSFYHLALGLIDRHPELAEDVNRRIEKFTVEPSKRSKPTDKNDPTSGCNIANLLILPLFSDKYDWRTFSDAYILESFIRNYLWVTKRSGGFRVSAEEDLKQSKAYNFAGNSLLIFHWFQATWVSRRLVLFYIDLYDLIRFESLPGKRMKTFLTIDQVRRNLDQRFGMVSEYQELMIFKSVKALHSQSWDSFFNKSGYVAPTPSELMRLFYWSMCMSARKGYHSKELEEKNKCRSFRTRRSAPSEKPAFLIEIHKANEMRKFRKRILDQYEAHLQTMDPNRFIGLQAGDLIDVMYHNCLWYLCRVVEMDNENQRVFIHYEQYSAKYDEWIPLKSPYLSPAHTFTLEVYIGVPHHGDQPIQRYEKHGQILY
jgi:ubiquitin-protein ligase